MPILLVFIHSILLDMGPLQLFLRSLILHAPSTWTSVKANINAVFSSCHSYLTS